MTKKKIEELKNELPQNTPFANMMKINNLLANNEITQEEARELLNWNMGFEMDWVF